LHIRRRRNGFAERKSKGVRSFWYFILPYGLITVVLLVILTLIDNHFFNVSAQKDIAFARSVFATLERNDTEKLKAALELALDNQEYLTLFEQRDRNELYQTLSPIFENLKQRYRITRWYFHNTPPDNTLVL
jgi:hypothetical protein